MDLEAKTGTIQTHQKCRNRGIVTFCLPENLNRIIELVMDDRIAADGFGGLEPREDGAGVFENGTRERLSERGTARERRGRPLDARRGACACG